jgi:hypothetical protein
VGSIRPCTFLAVTAASLPGSKAALVVVLVLPPAVGTVIQHAVQDMDGNSLFARGKAGTSHGAPAPRVDVDR